MSRANISLKQRKFRMNDNTNRWFCLMSTITSKEVDVMVRVMIATIQGKRVAVVPSLKKLFKDVDNPLLDACSAICTEYNADNRYKYNFLTIGWNGESEYERRNVKRWWSDADILQQLMGIKRAMELDKELKEVPPDGQIRSST